VCGKKSRLWWAKEVAFTASDRKVCFWHWQEAIQLRDQTATDTLKNVGFLYGSYRTACW
jgi:hypothetical protein